MKHIVWIGIWLLSLVVHPGLRAGETLSNTDKLWQQVMHPQSDHQPWAIWYWMYGAISKAGIEADLSAMKEVGLAGAYLMTIKGQDKQLYPDAVNQLTPEWWELIRYAMQKADSLDLELGMHITDGFALAGGPWIQPEESMQKIVWTDTIVSGGKNRYVELRQPETVAGYYRDIAVYALPAADPKKDIAHAVPTITSDNPEDPHPFSIAGRTFRSDSACYIQFAYAEKQHLQSVEIIPSGNNLQSQRFKILVSNNGVSFYEHHSLQPPRQGWQNTGFNYTYDIPPVDAKYFRFYWTPAGTEPGSEDLDAGKWRPNLKVNGIRLSSEERIRHWEGKSGLVWRIDTEDVPDKPAAIRLNQVQDISEQLEDGKGTLNLPRGNWRLIRMGHTSTGQTNATGGGGKGLECDKFSTQAVQKQFEHWFGSMYTQTDSLLASKVITYMHMDSWECGSQNWSENFASEFRQRRGYDLMPWFPVLAGFPIESTEKSEQVLRDVRTTIADLVSEVFYQVMSDHAKRLDLRLSTECVAPTMISDGMQHFRYADVPMGEFWLDSPTHDKPNDMLDAISGARIYGKNIVQAEGFTQLRTVWNEYPGSLKKLLDRNYALGMNKLAFHVFVHNPFVDKAPGMTLDGIGLFFQRDQSWWKQSKAFVDYITRSQVLLQFGHPVVDIAVYTGEEMPRRALTPEKLVPYLPGIIGKEKVDAEKRRLLNANQPMSERPVNVVHAAHTFTLEGWEDPLNGYAYDSFNRDALMRLAQVQDGRLSFGNGIRYSVLIFPDTAFYAADTRQKIQRLKKAGVRIPELPIIDNAQESLLLTPDVLVPKQVSWTHRSDGQTDIYFISNQLDQTRKLDLSFRMAEGIPEIWDMVEGKRYRAAFRHTADKRTAISLDLPASGAVFVVFGGESKDALPVYATDFTDYPDLGDQSWTLDFERTGIQVETKELFDWTTESNPELRYYSGTVVYTTEFELNELPENPLWISFEKLDNIASVRINGKDCGTIWTRPFRLDIQAAVQVGKNHLEIEVTNTWANALKAMDQGIPPFENIWTNGKYRRKGNQLEPAGIGGVKFIIENKN